MPNTHVPAAGGALPTAQHTTFLAVTPTMRLRIATTIENLIALLDEIDSDADLEDGGDLEFDPAELGIGDHAALHEIMVGGGVSC
ncbi:hypothetical protein [Mesorhizobium sp. IMUNJ 23232]|uniref:hypothetical protein n=1 Tax=Mesorhizobium sp. IMUNJ 23232 TaxID=3376064 RepID=UPI0037A88DE0